MRELDIKLDDGIPVSGVVRATVDSDNPANLAAVISQATGATACVSADTPPVWDSSADSQDCNSVLLY